MYITKKLRAAKGLAWIPRYFLHVELFIFFLDAQIACWHRPPSACLALQTLCGVFFVVPMFPQNLPAWDHSLQPAGSFQHFLQRFQL